MTTPAHAGGCWTSARHDGRRQRYVGRRLPVRRCAKHAGSASRPPRSRGKGRRFLEGRGRRELAIRSIAETASAAGFARSTHIALHLILRYDRFGEHRISLPGSRGERRRGVREQSSRSGHHSDLHLHADSSCDGHSCGGLHRAAYGSQRGARSGRLAGRQLHRRASIPTVPVEGRALYRTARRLTPARAQLLNLAAVSVRRSADHAGTSFIKAVSHQ